MATTSDIPSALVSAATAANWPLELIRHGLEAGVSAERIERAMKAGYTGMTPQRTMEMLVIQAGARREPSVMDNLQSTISPQTVTSTPPLEMEWADAPTERGLIPEIGPRGLELAAIEQGTYGMVPDVWELENDTPRGAYPSAAASKLAASYTIYNKYEVWADNAADLYEVAVRNHWVSATALPWSSLQPLPARIELAIDQLCTTWSEQSQLGLEAVSKWLEHISYGFHEIKLYLATATFDYGRHTEAFRKRALANGGGLGLQTPGVLNRAAYSAMKFTEMVCILMVVRASFTVSLLEDFGPVLARSEVDRKLYELVARDLRSHLAYGLEHLRYFVTMAPRKRDQVHAWLNRGEGAIAAEMRRFKPYNAALMLLLDDDPMVAAGKLKEVRRHQVDGYRQHLITATLRDHKVSDFLTSLIEEPAAGGI